MSFDLTNFAQSFAGGGGNIMRGLDMARYGTGINNTRTWSYTTDTALTDVAVAGYFNSVARLLQIGDAIDVTVVDDVAPATRDEVVTTATLIVTSNAVGAVTTSLVTNFASVTSAGRLVTSIGLRISPFLTSYDESVDQRAQVQVAVQELINGDEFAYLDLEGRFIGVSGTVAPTGSLGASNEKYIINGRLRALDDLSDWTVVTKTSVTTTALSTSISMASTTGLQVGDHISGTGIPRETYVTALTGTTVTMSNNAYVTNAGGATITFTRFVYMLDLVGMTEWRALTMRGVTFQCNKFVSGVRVPNTQNGTPRFEQCHWQDVRGRGYTCPTPVTTIMDQCVADSSQASVAPGSRIDIFGNFGGDSKVRNCQIRYFKHVVVTKSAITYQGNHNFQGMAGGSDDNTRTAELVLQGRTADSVITGNYIDNAYVEVTDECQTGAGSPLGWLTMTNNRCIVTPSGDALDFAWLVIRPFSANRVLRHIVVKNNLFKNAATGSDTDRFWRIDTDMGSISTGTPPDCISMTDNIQNSLNYRTNTRPTLSVTKAQADAAASWTFDFANLFPFGMSIARVLSVVCTNLIDGSGTSQYDQPRITVSGTTLTATFAAARAGTIYATVDCSSNDPGMV